MRNISEEIEHHLKLSLQKSPDNVIEIQRNELADYFQCVPSQINYVISTRFTLEKGYLVESKRGGRGYIRIQRLKLPEEKGIHEVIFDVIGSQLSQSAGEGVVYQLVHANLITEREANMMNAAISREVLNISLPLRDEIRAKLIRAMLISLLSK